MIFSELKPGDRFQFKEDLILSVDVYFEKIGNNSIAFDELVLVGDEEVELEEDEYSLHSI